MINALNQIKNRKLVYNFPYRSSKKEKSLTKVTIAQNVILVVFIGGKFIFKKNPLQDLHSSPNTVISTNERHCIITDHLTFKLRYNQNHPYVFIMYLSFWIFGPRGHLADYLPIGCC